MMEEMEKYLREDDKKAVAFLKSKAGTNGCSRYRPKSPLKIDTGKWNCACWDCGVN